MAFAADFSAPTGGYNLRYVGNRGVSLSRDHQRVQVSLVRSNGAPALAVSYLVDMLHSSADFTVDEHLVENGLQQIPLVGTAELEPGDLLGTSSCPLLRVLVASILHNNDCSRLPRRAPHDHLGLCYTPSGRRFPRADLLGPLCSPLEQNAPSRRPSAR